MVKNKIKLNKHNSSGWLDDYSEEFSINTNPSLNVKENNGMKQNNGGYLKNKNTYVTKDGRETKRGLWANVYLKNHKYPAGGYLGYQDEYKGFGIGPKLYQDNSYFRSIMPDYVENMQAQINQPSIFSGINNVLGGVNQGLGQVNSLLSNFTAANMPAKKLTQDTLGGIEGVTTSQGMTKITENIPDASYHSMMWGSTKPQYVAPTQQNGGYINHYAGGGLAEIYSDSYGSNYGSPTLYNANSSRMGLDALQSATANDFLHTKVAHDRIQKEDDKVNWGFADFLKAPTEALVGGISSIPIVGDAVGNALGDSYFTRSGAYKAGKNIGKSVVGAGKVIGGALTGNVGLIGSGIGDVGSGVGSTIGELNAESGIEDYNKAGYVSGKRMVNASQDFGSLMNNAAGIYGNISGGINNINNFGGFDQFTKPLMGGKTDAKGVGNLIGNLTGFSMENGGVVDNDYLALQQFLNGGLTPNKAETMLHDKNFKSDKQRKYFGYIASQKKKTNNGWLDTL